ncbi:MAG: NADH-quinone oxidoreductase subunit NuoK [Bdellovibrionota bacterium]
MEMAGLHSYLLIAAFLFCAGSACVLMKRNVIHMLMGVELIFNASALNFVAFSRFAPSQLDVFAISGQVVALFVIVLAAAEAAVALALVLSLFQMIKSSDVSKMSSLKG